MMRECWINVYENEYGNTWYGAPRPFPIIHPIYKLLYRIHVRMKEPEIPYLNSGLKGY